MGLAAETVYLFRHALMREAAYDLQAPSDRARLHRTALSILEKLVDGVAESDSWAEELAYHARAAREQQGQESTALHGRELYWLRRAAAYATRSWANEAALDAWQRMAQHANATSVDKVRGWTQVAEILMRTGIPVRAEPPMRRALEALADCDDAAVRGECLAMNARMLVVLGRNAEARRQCEEAFGPARAAGPAAFGQLCNVAAQAAASMGDWLAAEKHVRDALELLVPGHDPGVHARANLHLADCLWRQGKLMDALQVYEHAVEMARQSRNPGTEASAWDHLASLQRELGRGEDARRNHERARALYAQVGDTVGMASALVNLANLDQGEGRLVAARAGLIEAVARFHAAGTITLEGIALGNLGGVCRKLGRLTESAACYERARELLARAGNLIEVAVFDGMYAQLLLLAGAGDAAEVNARQAMATLEKQGALHWREQYGGLVFMRVLAERAAAGSAMALREAIERLAEMRAVLGKADYNGHSALAVVVEKAAALVSEVERATAKGRRPLVFRGFLPQELEPAVRKAAIARMKMVEPGEYAKLASDPDLLAAMQQGLETGHEPDWQASEV